jgi:uncharacterized protein DUF3568
MPWTQARLDEYGAGMKGFRSFALICAVALVSAGCDPVSLTMLGVGAGAGVAHQMGGYASKTFTETLPRVKRATVVALNRMAIRVDSTEKSKGGEIIKATAGDRRIEIELEALSPKTTRISAVARRDALTVDSATAVEIIVQTERSLVEG